MFYASLTPDPDPGETVVIEQGNARLAQPPLNRLKAPEVSRAAPCGRDSCGTVGRSNYVPAGFALTTGTVAESKATTSARVASSVEGSAASACKVARTARRTAGSSVGVAVANTRARFLQPQLLLASRWGCGGRRHVAKVEPISRRTSDSQPTARPSSSPAGLTSGSRRTRASTADPQESSLPLSVLLRSTVGEIAHVR